MLSFIDSLIPIYSLNVEPNKKSNQTPHYNTLRFSFPFFLLFFLFVDISPSFLVKKINVQNYYIMCFDNEFIISLILKLTVKISWIIPCPPFQAETAQFFTWAEATSNYSWRRVNVAKYDKQHIRGIPTNFLPFFKNKSSLWLANCLQLFMIAW